jgi:hypothetical protein
VVTIREGQIASVKDRLERATQVSSS